MFRSPCIEYRSGARGIKMITTHHSGSIYGTKIGPKSTNARSALCCLPAFSIRRPKAVVTRKARYSPSKHLVQLLESSSSTSARLISPTKRLRPSDCCTRRAVLLARHTGQRQADVLRPQSTSTTAGSSSCSRRPARSCGYRCILIWGLRLRAGIAHPM